MMGIEIIPNWHPIFVHFSVALLSISALLYLAGLALRKPNLLLVARWNLWIGAAATIATVFTGLDAYNSIPHDGPLHAMMTDHKNWALVTAPIFGVLALWSLARQRGAKAVSVGFVALMLIASGLLAVTGYKGGEVVYRHGGGVMRMPEISGDGGHGTHAHAENDSASSYGAAETKPHGNHDGHDTSIESPAAEEIQDNHGAHVH